MLRASKASLSRSSDDIFSHDGYYLFPQDNTGRTMGRRTKSRVAKDLLALPWQFSAAIALASFVAIRWVLPDVVPASPLTTAFKSTFEPVSWIALCAFGFLSLASAIRMKTAGSLQDHASVPAGQRPRAAFKRETNRPASTDIIMPASQAASVPRTWSLASLRLLEWKRFEMLCARYYEAVGFKSETLAAGPDGGIDVKLFKIDPSKPLAIVQCKAWNTRQVGVKEIRELLGVMVHETLARGIFITTGSYTQDAIAFGAANPIQLLDGAAFVQKMLELPQEKQQALLAFAFDGDYRTPSCASCGVKMVARDSKRGPFWGCTHYPRCKNGLHMRTPSAVN